MEELATFGGIILGLLIRIGLPLGLTFLLGWFLRRLDAKWRAEAMHEKAEAISQTREISGLEQDFLYTIWSSDPCWVENNCPPEERIKCEAFQQADKPCWEVFRNNGSFSKECTECAYREELMRAVEQNKIGKLN